MRREGTEGGTAAGPEGDARSDRTPYERDAPDGTDDTRESRGGDADFEKLSSHLTAGSGHRAGFLNAR
jgi:hypothetical protein